jgi:hypothetical protein
MRMRFCGHTFLLCFLVAARVGLTKNPFLRRRRCIALTGTYAVLPVYRQPPEGPPVRPCRTTFSLSISNLGKLH